MHRDRSEAAKRGWRTRRANARKRSEAAKRGWETRRKNQRAQLRKRRRPKKKLLPAPIKRVPIRSLREWYYEYDEADDFYDEDIGGGVETGEEGI